MSNEISISDILETVDIPTRLRAASLSAKGLMDHQICDILLLTEHQIIAVKGSEEYKKKYADEATQQIERQFDLEEGWDSLEEEALGIMLETMKFNRDPKFALLVARSANAAERRSKSAKNIPKIADASNKTTNNIVILNLNKNYVNKSSESRMIDVSARPAQIPLKQSDVPAPKLVDQILSDGEAFNTKEKTPAKQMEEDLQQMITESGVVFDQN